MKLLNSLFLTLITVSLNAATYYIDWDTGNDSTGDGSSGNRWKTFKKGVDTMSSGDTLYVGEGTYAEASWPPSWKDSMTIIGEGDAWATIINPSVDEGASIYTFGWSSIDNSIIRNLRIQRDNAGSVGGALKLVSLCISNTFDNVIFDGADDQHNVLVATSSGSNFSDYNVFTNCTWTNIVGYNDGVGSPPHGLYITGGRNNLFTHCRFAGSTNDQHDFQVHVFNGDSTNNVFEYCTFIFGKQEVGARIMGMVQGEYTIVRNCVFYNVDAQNYPGTACQISSPGSLQNGMVFVNNTVYGMDSGISIYGATNAVVANNIFARHRGGGWGLNVGTDARSLTIENNYWTNPTNYSGGTYTNLAAGATYTSFTGNYFGAGGADTANESFADAAAGNFRLGADSIFIDAGRDTSSATYGTVTDDFDGTARGGTYDVGAFEYSAGGGGDPATAVKRRGKIPGLGRGRGSWR